MEKVKVNNKRKLKRKKRMKNDIYLFGGYTRNYDRMHPIMQGICFVGISLIVTKILIMLAWLINDIYVYSQYL